MLIWIAILLLCDAAFALWQERRLVNLLPRLNVRLYAIIEAAIGLFLVLLHVLRRAG